MQDTRSAADRRRSDVARRASGPESGAAADTWSETLAEPPVDTPLVVLIPYPGELSDRGRQLSDDR
jgi:hypothetical protein